jgi:DNA polymerase-3 subunit delta
LLHVLIGDDDYSIRQALEEIKKSIGDATALMTNTTILDGKSVTAEQLRNAGETMPFLAEKRLVIIEGLLERFEPGGRTGRKKASRQAGPSDEYAAIAEAITKTPPFTEMVTIGGKIKAGNPLLRELSTAARVRNFQPLRPPQLSQWVEHRIKEAGGSISRQALTLLVRFVGNDLWSMANEVDKLVLFAGGRCIEEADVKAVVSSAREESVFSMVDAVLEFRTGAAQSLLQQMFRQGIAPAQLLVMLSRQVRIILQVREMRVQGRSRGDIQSKLGLNSEFVLRKAWEQADKYSPSRLRELYHRLLETDISIKTGRMDGEIALNILVTELGQRGTVSA